jgi:hypothetical protein
LSFDFLCFFLSNLIFILFISIYFAINLFSDWILFFNLIPNHLILIFFSWIWSLFFLLQILLFWLISMIFFCLFHPSLFYPIEFSYHIGSFFIMLLKPDSGVDPRHVLRHWFGWMTRFTMVNQTFYCVGSKSYIIWIKKKLMEKINRWILTWFSLN